MGLFDDTARCQVDLKSLHAVLLMSNIRHITVNVYN